MAQAKKSKTKKTASKKAAPKKAVAKKTVAKKAAPAKAKAKDAVSKKAKKSAKPAGKKTSASSARPVLKLMTSTPKWDSFLTPLDDRVIVSVKAEVTQTAGGLYIPATASQERPNHGTVLAVGRGHRNKKGSIKPMDVQAGDEVLFAAFTGTEMKLEGHDVVILREADLLGIVE